MADVSHSDIADSHEWTVNQLRALRFMLAGDGLLFMKYFFYHRHNFAMVLNWHHLVIEYCLQAILELKINRLIINIPPGYSKTQQAVINFIARCLAVNPAALFIHTSYSPRLAQANSMTIRNTIVSPEYQTLFPMALSSDAASKTHWLNEYNGGVMAASSKGQITGFRAGLLDRSTFTGAFISDDPLKPDDAYSTTRREHINENFNNTARSRLGNENVPMIIIMQRLHEDDLTGFLLKGGSGDRWHHLMIPALFDEQMVSMPYFEDYTHSNRIDINGVLNAIRTGTDYDFQPSVH